MNNLPHAVDMVDGRQTSTPRYTTGTVALLFKLRAVPSVKATTPIKKSRAFRVFRGQKIGLTFFGFLACFFGMTYDFTLQADAYEISKQKDRNNHDGETSQNLR